MTEPIFDKDGYPTEETLQAIEKWPYADIQGLLEFVKQAWCDYGRYWTENKESEIYFATGGWSGNEFIVQAMRQNAMFWAICWKQSTRGGLFIFEIPISQPQSPASAPTVNTPPPSNP